MSLPRPLQILQGRPAALLGGRELSVPNESPPGHGVPAVRRCVPRGRLPGGPAAEDPAGGPLPRRRPAAGGVPGRVSRCPSPGPVPTARCQCFRGAVRQPRGPHRPSQGLGRTPGLFRFSSAGMTSGLHSPVADLPHLLTHCHVLSDLLSASSLGPQSSLTSVPTVTTECGSYSQCESCAPCAGRFVHISSLSPRRCFTRKVGAPRFSDAELLREAACPHG